MSSWFKVHGNEGFLEPGENENETTSQLTQFTDKPFTVSFHARFMGQRDYSLLMIMFLNKIANHNHIWCDLKLTRNFALSTYCWHFTTVTLVKLGIGETTKHKIYTMPWPCIFFMVLFSDSRGRLAQY